MDLYDKLKTVKMKFKFESIGCPIYYNFIRRLDGDHNYVPIDPIPVGVTFDNSIIELYMHAFEALTKIYHCSIDLFTSETQIFSRMIQDKAPANITLRLSPSAKDESCQIAPVKLITSNNIPSENLNTTSSFSIKIKVKMISILNSVRISCDNVFEPMSIDIVSKLHAKSAMIVIYEMIMRIYKIKTTFNINLTTIIIDVDPANTDEINNDYLVKAIYDMVLEAKKALSKEVEKHNRSIIMNNYFPTECEPRIIIDVNNN